MHRTTRSILLILTALTLGACGSNDGASSAANPGLDAQKAAPDDADDGHSHVGKGHGDPKGIRPVVERPDAATVERQKLPRLGRTWTSPKGKKPKAGARAQGVGTLAFGDRADVVGLRILIVTAGPNDVGLAAARAMLAQQAVPFDVLDATTTELTEGALINADGSGQYQGVVLTTGNLAWQDPATQQWGSALSQSEWELLWNYERVYKARQLAMYTYPGTYPEDYGVRDAGGESDTAAVGVTDAGRAVFSDVTPGGSVPVRYAWNYPATVENVAGITTTPLLTGQGGRVLGVRSDTSDGRQRIALTMAHNPHALHTQVLSYGLVQWVTGGVHLGEFRRYLQVDVDDWFLEDDLWNVDLKAVSGTYRINAADARGVRDQQTALRSKFAGVASKFTYAIAFNAGGANVNATSTCTPGTSGDPLSSVSKCLSQTFDWVNHSRDHLSMDFATYDDAYFQFNNNFRRAATMGLKVSAGAIVSGEHSGLGWYNPQRLDYDKTDFGLGQSNTAFLRAARAIGVKYVASNRGVDSHWDATCPNCGLTHPLDASLFLVPRWPTNIFYYASTPEEVVSSYNHMYGPSGVTPFFASNQTYAQILVNETDVAMNHLLSGSMFPHYMHQTNFRRYNTSTSAGKSLATDWTDAVLTRYSAYSTLPLRTLAWSALAPLLKDRTAFVKANVSGTWNRKSTTAAPNGTLTLHSPTAVSAFLTGTRNGTTESYGQTVISRVNLGANVPVTLPVVK